LVSTSRGDSPSENITCPALRRPCHQNLRCLSSPWLGLQRPEITTLAPYWLSAPAMALSANSGLRGIRNHDPVAVNGLTTTVLSCPSADVQSSRQEACLLFRVWAIATHRASTDVAIRNDPRTMRAVLRVWTGTPPGEPFGIRTLDAPLRRSSASSVSPRRTRRVRTNGCSELTARTRSAPHDDSTIRPRSWSRSSPTRKPKLQDLGCALAAFRSRARSPPRPRSRRLTRPLREPRSLPLSTTPPLRPLELRARVPSRLSPAAEALES
jgi:hypothetical protein